MKGRRAIALLLGLTVSLLSLAACEKEPEAKRIGMIRPATFQLAQLDQPALGELVRPELPFGGFRKGPKPMPGRLLVQVKSTEVRKLFTYTPLGDNAVRQTFPYLRALPATLKVSDAEEVEQLADGSTLIRVRLEKAIPAKQVRQLLRNTPFKLSERTTRTRTPTRLPLQELREIVLTTRLDRVSLPDRRLGFRQYREIEKKSDLHQVFHEIGVRSLRRVFRMVEKPTRRGTYQVQSMKSLMRTAKTKFPQRASRGYDYVQLPDNMENWFLLRLDRKADLERAAKVLAERPEIEAVSYDYPVIPHAPADEPLYSQQWHLHPHVTALSPFGRGIDAEPAWAITVGNTPVLVAVIGSGIKEDLNEFNGRIWQNPGELGLVAGVDDDNNGYVDDISGITTSDVGFGSPPPVVAGTHETEVASIIGAAVNNTLITGVVGEADVRFMNISLGPTWGCAELAEAIQYATDNGAEIVNMSLGAAPNLVLAEAIQNALSTDGGLILVASAGNANRRVAQNYGPVGAHYPAWYDGVIAVGGTEDIANGGAGNNGKRWVDDASRGSNYGPGLDLVAPARNIPTATFSSPTQILAERGNMTGTSASAAIVSGVAALLIGRYPTLTAAEVRSWLRATSVDLTDPEDTGTANLVGDDIYTGAGLVSASQAVTSATPDPVVADLMVERIADSTKGGAYRLNAGIRNAVASDPNLGVTVQGPAIATWSLDYRLGDDPTAWDDPSDPTDDWIPITVPNALQGVVDVPRTVAGMFDHYIDVADSHNGSTTSLLPTDGLQNRQVYTMRLTATAGSQTVTDYDWFMPIRAMLLFPTKNAAVPTRWDWPEIDGIVDTRSGASYDLSVLPMSGPTNPNWQMTARTPLLGPLEVNRGANFTRLTVAPGTYPGEGYPLFAAPPSGEAPHVLELTVHSPSGVTTTDTQEIYIDGSSFAVRPGWPVSTSPYGGASVHPRGIVVADMDGTGQHRIFLHHQQSFLCLTPDGTVLWELPIYSSEDWVAVRYPPAFLVEDLDGDGTKEIVVASYTPSWGPTPPNYPPNILNNEKYVLVLRPDGSLYNANWPVRLPIIHPNFDELGKISVGDVDGDGSKEIIFFELAPLGVGAFNRLHVLDLNGQALPGWPVEIDPGPADVPVVADIDADGKTEIMLDLLRSVYEDNGQSSGSWPPADLAVSTHYYGGVQIRQLDGDAELEIIEYGTATLADEQRVTIDVREHDGGRLPGNWPAYLDAPIFRAETSSFDEYLFRSRVYVDTAQIVAGGTPEIVVAHDKIQVLDTAGNQLNSLGLPEIFLGGHARGLKVMDVDGDGALEYVVLVLKFEDDDGFKMRAYGDLDAYELDGTGLSLGGRWPVRVAFEGKMALGNMVAIEDIDGNGSLEVINFLGHHPHRHWVDLNYPTRTGGLWLPRVIEVLDIP